MIEKLTMFTVCCDNCGVSADEGTEYSCWNDEITAKDTAMESNWVMDGDNHYCLDCVSYDDDDNIELNEKRRKPNFHTQQKAKAQQPESGNTCRWIGDCDKNCLTRCFDDNLQPESLLTDKVYEWISVSERLPTEIDADEYGKVLLFRRSNEGQRDMKKTIYPYRLVKVCDKDTFWMPLPKNPITKPEKPILKK